jgi:dinuclear metal center YbgI/SA1388 family protein
MTQVKDVLDAIEKIAPEKIAFDFDAGKIGLAIGDRQAPVKKAVVSLERSLGAIDFAIGNQADLFLAHHPLFWDSLQTIHYDSYVGKAVQKLIQNNINMISAHTNWDCASGGVNTVLADLLELDEIEPFGSAVNYDGEEDSFSLFPVGRIGLVKNEIRLEDFARFVAQKLDTNTLTWGDPNLMIKKVAAIGGSGDDEWANALKEGAQVLVTGDVQQHNAVEAVENGVALISAGHFATEHPGCVRLAEKLGQLLPDVEWLVYEPAKGFSGRPF